MFTVKQTLRYGLVFALFSILTIPTVQGQGEGWVWRESFDVESHTVRKLPINQIHRDLARQEATLYERLNERQANKSCAVNIALASLSIMVEDPSTGELHLITEPISDLTDEISFESPRPLVFLSGSGFSRQGEEYRPLIAQNDFTRTYDFVMPNELEKILKSVRTSLQREQSTSIPLLDPTISKRLLSEVEKGLQLIQNLNTLVQELESTGEKRNVTFTGNLLKKRIDELEKFKGSFIETPKGLEDSGFVVPDSLKLMFTEAKEKIDQKLLLLRRIQVEGQAHDDSKIKDKYYHTEQQMLLRLEDSALEKFTKYVINARINPAFQGKRPVIRGALFHLHSRLDVCERCAPILTLESQRLGSTIKAVLKAENPATAPNPVFHTLVSVRQELSNDQNDVGYRRHQFGHDGHFHEPIQIMDPNPQVYMKVVEPFSM